MAGLFPPTSASPSNPTRNGTRRQNLYTYVVAITGRGRGNVFYNAQEYLCASCATVSNEMVSSTPQRRSLRYNRPPAAENLLSLAHRVAVWSHRIDKIL